MESSVDLFLDQSLKALHNDRGECNRAVAVDVAVDCRIIVTD